MPAFRILSVIVFLSVIASAQDLPAGPGKDLFEKVCSQCHGLDIITNLKHTKAEWKAVVDTMAGYGASAKDEELDAIVDYLAKNFGKDAAQQAAGKVHLHAPSVIRP
jgi:mono/diheme cytochrome c family protein